LDTSEPDEELPFQNRVRLEVSGIRSGDSSRVKARVKQKKEQTNPSDCKNNASKTRVKPSELAVE